MHTNGRDARRRNRNIGTKKSGHGQDNRLTIPESWADNRLFHERLNNPIAIKRKINGSLITFLVEEIQTGFCHACTPQDIEFLLRLIPSAHLTRIKMVVLRQPKLKERILSPVWGRLLYWSEIGLYSGPAIHLEAQLINGTTRRDKSLTPEEKLELTRLEQDGHKIQSDRRSYHITNDLLAIRNTQLYRTLPHEIGHYVDYLESVTNRAGDNQDEWNKLDALFGAKPRKDREDFAHRYATTFYEQQVKLGHIPFPRIFDCDRLAEAGIDPRWFSH